MKNTNMDEYEEEIDNFERTIKDSSYTFIDNQDYEELIDVFNRVYLKESLGKKLKDVDLKALFLDTIKKMGKDTQDFYKNQMPKIKLVRDPYIGHDEAYSLGKKDSQLIHITYRPLYAYDFACFSHELGHIPGFIKVAKDDYFEYNEVLPMLMEYLAWYKAENIEGIYEFLKNRLAILKESAQVFFYYKYSLEGLDDVGKKYLEMKTKRVESYFHSFEYVLKLIERISEDEDIALSEVDKYVTGDKSLKDIGKTLGIDTSGCKKLLKIAKGAAK